jgi:transcription elongation factor Elf1|tara:strand:+ start:134 stop:706 length:573 start_codon:yes stop_codon:yes gene_type:complete
MKNESILKKEFQKKDVERLRNLMKGKYGEKTRSSVGFSKADNHYEEGDVWKSDGRTWTIKDGIKQNITKLDKAKKTHIMPLLCPKCSKLMKRIDKPYYNANKHCLNCQAKFEDQLKKEGKYAEHYNKINDKIIDKRIEEFKIFVEEKLRESNDSFISENGEIEKWIGKLDKDRVMEYVQLVSDKLNTFKS